MKPFPEEYELLQLFEVEPKLGNPDLPWAYNRLTFATARERHSIECTIEPGYRLLRLRWSSEGARFIDINMDGVEGLRVEISKEREAMIATLSDGELVLQLKPHVHLWWNKVVSE